MCFRTHRNPEGIRINFKIDTVLLTENLAYNIIELLDCMGWENDCLQYLAVDISRMVMVDDQGMLFWTILRYIGTGPS